jgi:hypothetical protein
MMKEHPILFSGEMVKAILEGRKSQTRRVIKPQPFDQADGSWHIMLNPRSGYNSERTLRNMLPYRCPYGQPGDRLWVREKFQITIPSGSVGDEWIGDETSEVDGPLPKVKPESLGYWLQIVYAADEPDQCSWWRPSIFMPRWASRITLEIVKIRVERLQDISRDDAMFEGVEVVNPYAIESALPPGMPAAFKDYRDASNFFTADPIRSYRSLWENINSKETWTSNPWVWVIGFKVVNDAR